MAAGLPSCPPGNTLTSTRPLVTFGNTSASLWPNFSCMSPRVTTAHFNVYSAATPTSIKRAGERNAKRNKNYRKTSLELHGVLPRTAAALVCFCRSRELMF